MDGETISLETATTGVTVLGTLLDEVRARAGPGRAIAGRPRYVGAAVTESIEWWQTWPGAGA